MKVTVVYPNGNFRVTDSENEYDISQIMDEKTVKIGDEIEFTDYRLKTVKFVKDGKYQSKIVILSLGFKVA